MSHLELKNTLRSEPERDLRKLNKQSLTTKTARHASEIRADKNFLLSFSVHVEKCTSKVLIASAGYLKNISRFAEQISGFREKSFVITSDGCTL